MSTISKLNSEVRRQRAMRRNLLRNPPRKAHPAVMAELALIHAHSGITGAVKQMLFERGAAQLAAVL